MEEVRIGSKGNSDVGGKGRDRDIGGEINHCDMLSTVFFFFSGKRSLLLTVLALRLHLDQNLLLTHHLDDLTDIISGLLQNLQFFSK